MKKIFVAILIILSINIAKAQQNNEMTRRYFPDPNVSLNTPSVNLKEDRFAKYDEIISWIDNNLRGKQNCQIEYIGKTPMGYDIPIIKISKPNGKKRLNVWFQGGLHGNEPAAAEAMFEIADYLVNGEGVELLDDMNVTILPIANIDGYLAQTRRSSDGYDLNRDQSKYTDVISPIIKRAYISSNADVSVDFHEYTPTKSSYELLDKGRLTSMYDVLFLTTGHNNIPKAIRDINVDYFQKDAELALDKYDYSYNFYYSPYNNNGELAVRKGAKNPQSSVSSYGLTNSFSILVEIRGIGIGRTSFKRRVHSGFVVAKSFLETTQANRKLLSKTLNKSLKGIMKNKDVINVLSDSKETHYNLSFINPENNEKVVERVKTYDAMESTPILMRERPVGYIIEKDCERAVEILDILGISYYVLKLEDEFNVESYYVEKSEEKKRWEGIKPLEIKEVRVEKSNRKFPTGSIIVNLKQKHANLIVSLLEPESHNGFMHFRVCELKGDNMVPIHRIQK